MSFPLIGFRILSSVAGLTIACFVATNTGLASTPSMVSVSGSGIHVGTLLIAAEQVHNEMFAHSVVLITAHDDNGTFGLVLNKPLSPRTATPPKFDLHQNDPQLFLGGPVGPHLISALIRPVGDHRLDGKVGANIFLVMGVDEILEAAHDSMPLTQLRLYIGYAGWAHSQLELEIANGDWIVATLDDAAVLDIPIEGLWEVLRERWKGYWASIENSSLSRLAEQQLQTVLKNLALSLDVSERAFPLTEIGRFKTRRLLAK